MKALLLFTTLLASQISFANTECQKEAQIIAKVTGRETDNLTYCKAQIGKIIQYNQSQVCPLDLDEVLVRGVDMPLENGHDCNVPEEISGVLVQRAWGPIILE